MKTLRSAQHFSRAHLEIKKMSLTGSIALSILRFARDEPKNLRALIDHIYETKHILSSSKLAQLRFVLDTLENLGALEVIKQPADSARKPVIADWYLDEYFRAIDGREGLCLFKSTNMFTDLMAFLDISLTDLTHYRRDQSIIISPYFGKPRSADENEEVPDIFVLMPFAPELKPVYEDHIKKVATELNLRVTRADDLFSKDSVMTDIWNAMNQAKLCIADCTGRNPNVFYEIGLAHTINKAVILITRNEDDVPFDLRHLRYVKYRYTPKGMIAFEKQLRTAIPKIMEADHSNISKKKT